MVMGSFTLHLLKSWAVWLAKVDHLPAQPLIIRCKWSAKVCPPARGPNDLIGALPSNFEAPIFLIHLYPSAISGNLWDEILKAQPLPCRRVGSTLSNLDSRKSSAWRCTPTRTPTLPADVFNVPPVRQHSLDRCTEERPVQPMLSSALVVARLFSLTKKDQNLASLASLASLAVASVPAKRLSTPETRIWQPRKQIDLSRLPCLDHIWMCLDQHDWKIWKIKPTLLGLWRNQHLPHWRPTCNLLAAWRQQSTVAKLHMS